MMTATPAHPMIDTHAHLDDPSFEGDVDKVINRAGAVGVTRIINIGYRPAIWRTTVALAQKYPAVNFALGLHPNHAEEEAETVWAELRRLIGETRPAAVGEIGLDFFRDHASRATQLRVFDRQLELAAEMKLPVVIHQRAAEADLIGMLREPVATPWILHSFDGTRALAETAVSAGCYFGVGGLMTKAASAELRNVIKGIPTDRLLLETDSPYLVPRGVKNRRNEPANIPSIAQALAELLERPVDEVARRTTENAERLFGFSSGDNR
jgi:TatD DNase family protein